MTFDQVDKLIQELDQKRIPQGLSEMLWCKPLAEYLNHKNGAHYEIVYKNDELDKLGIDIVMSERHNKKTELHIQLTHAREYDMSPVADNKNIDLSGRPVLEALEKKCTHYVARGIDTYKLVLIIQGILPVSYIHELMSDESYQKRFEEIDCFDGIYYISDKVYPLKETHF